MIAGLLPFFSLSAFHKSFSFLPPNLDTVWRNLRDRTERLELHRSGMRTQADQSYLTQRINAFRLTFASASPLQSKPVAKRT